GDRALNHQHEWVKLASVGFMPPFDEVIRTRLRAAFEIDQRPVHCNARETRKCAESDLFDAGLRRGCKCYRVAVTAEASVHPEDMNQRFRLCFLGGALGLRVSGHRGQPPRLDSRLRCYDASGPNVRTITAESWKSCVPVTHQTVVLGRQG